MNPHSVPFCWDLKGRDGQGNFSDLYYLLKISLHNAISNFIEQMEMFGQFPREIINMRKFTLDTLKGDVHIVAPAKFRDIVNIF